MQSWIMKVQNESVTAASLNFQFRNLLHWIPCSTWKALQKYFMSIPSFRDFPIVPLVRNGEKKYIKKSHENCQGQESCPYYKNTTISSYFTLMHPAALAGLLCLLKTAPSEYKPSFKRCYLILLFLSSLRMESTYKNEHTHTDTQCPKYGRQYNRQCLIGHNALNMEKSWTSNDTDSVYYAY